MLLNNNEHDLGLFISSKNVKRVEYIDIAKAIGIILVVWAHASGPYSSYIYQFHMPLFFLISGFLYNSNISIKEFVMRKIKTLYIPFVFWNLMFYVITAICNIDSKRTLSFGKGLVAILLTVYNDGQFCGATWFLGALFIMSIIYKVMDSLIKGKIIKDIIMILFFICLAIIGFNITLPAMFSRTLILGIFFAIGAFVKKYREKFLKYDCLVTALICMATFIIIGYYNSVNMGLNQYRFPILFVVGACMASYAAIYLSKIMQKLMQGMLRGVKRVIILLGQHSIDIVIWQFVFFRIVIIIQMYIHNEVLSVNNVLSYYPIYDSADGWWIIYTIVGVGLPVLWCSLLRSGVWGKLLKRIHIV